MNETSFFFQAEDGIRDKLVTGVQTCALPIYHDLVQRRNVGLQRHVDLRLCTDADLLLHKTDEGEQQYGRFVGHEIGRASCRERVWLKAVAANLQKPTKSSGLGKSPEQPHWNA